jgi:hypothetical protein
VSDADPDGPYAIVHQLELPLEGIEPLTVAQRVQAWLNAQDDESTSAYIAHLFLQDRRSRKARAARSQEVKSVQAPFDSEWGWLIHGGAESVWLYDEAVHAFVDGFPLASLLCSHAACERVLAGRILMHHNELPGNWTRWGLGNLVEAASEIGIIDAPLRAELLQVNEVRKVSAHFKPPLAENSLQSRVHSRVKASSTFLDSDEAWWQALDETAFEDALAALRVATRLMRG